MTHAVFPTIDPVATGKNIIRLRKARGLTVRQLQLYFGFEEPQAIYKWQQGKCLPSVDNLYALSRLLGVSMNSCRPHNSILPTTDSQPTVRFLLCYSKTRKAPAVLIGRQSRKVIGFPYCVNNLS